MKPSEFLDRSRTRSDTNREEGSVPNAQVRWPSLTPPTVFSRSSWPVAAKIKAGGP